ncbi:hypothetical protein [Streptomyces sp. NPDC059166]|uniref:hypothetical protein n=1 Tax=Streptomyces sp. NPDC059166 TaxID=3346752 RepID=UPI0036982848
MGIEIRGTDGRGGTLGALPGPADAPAQVTLLLGGAAGPASWSCSPAAARELAAALTSAAAEAELARSSGPVTVEACALKRGDVRDGERLMTVEDVRVDGVNVQVTWTSGGGRSWSQTYEADAAIRLRRRPLPGG